MDDENEPERGRNRDRNGGLLAAIRGVVEALADAEREGRHEFRGSGRIPKGHFTTNYRYSGRIGDSVPGSDGSRSRSNSGSTRETDECLVDVRYEDGSDELLVVADVPDVTVGDLTVGIKEETNELVIGLEDRPLERVTLPWPVDGADAQYHHGVLELRFAPAEERP